MTGRTAGRMAGWIDGIEGVLLDVDGTLLDGEAAIPGAAEALRRLRKAGVAIRLTTNTTRRPRSAVARALGEHGIDVDKAEVIVPASLARRRIVESGRTRAMLLVPSDCLADFDGVADGGASPDWVVVGDLAEGFTFARLNEAFLGLRRGASLLALQKNRFWYPAADTPALDAGPFVAALEFAAGTQAELVGKPARAFFALALRDLGLSAEKVLVVGDDVENDHEGGAAAGCRTALVRTGRMREAGSDGAGTGADLVLDSVAGLML